MHWIIQNNMFSEDGFERLVDALNRTGCQWSAHKIVPFTHHLVPEPCLLPPYDKIVVVGSYTLAREALARAWKPGAWMGENFDFVKQVSVWRQHMFNFHAHVCEFRNVPEQPKPFFIRPTEDSKSFTGYVADWLHFIEWQDKALSLTPEDGATLTGETMVLVAPPRPISREWRTWIVDGKVVTACQYKLGSRKAVDENVDDRVIHFASGMAQIWRARNGPAGDDLAPAYCLDVFESEGELYIGEVNNLNSAGFYAADMQKLVMAIERMVG